MKNFEKVDEYANKTIQLAYKLDLKKQAGNVYGIMARFFHGQTNYQKAEENYYKAIKEYYAVSNQAKIADTYLNMSDLYSLIPDYAKSLEASQHALEIYRKLNDEENVASCYVNISGIYQDLGQHKKALEYLRLAQNIMTRNGAKNWGVALVYKEIGIAYINATPSELINMDILPSQKLNVALDNLNTALKIAEEFGNDNNLTSSIKMNLGRVYEQMGEKDLALKAYLKAIELNKNSDNKAIPAQNLQALGNFYINQKDYANAVKLLTQSLNIAQRNKLLDIERDANLKLSDAYDKLKKYDESLAFYKQYVIVKDEIFNAEKEKEITRRQMQLDFGIKEKDYQLKQQFTDAILQQQVLLAKQQHQQLILRQQQLDLSDKEKMLQRLKFLQNQKDLENEKIAQHNNFEKSELESKNEALVRNKKISEQNQQIKFDEKVKIFLSVAIALVLCTAGLIYFNQRKTTRLNKIINKQKRELEQLSKVKDRIFSVVSHDMRTPVNSLISFIQLLEGGNIEQDKLKKYASSLKNNLMYTSSMMENLLNWAAGQMQGFNPYLETINVHGLSDDVVNSLRSTADLKHIKIENNVCEQATCEADTNMLELVLRNLLSNAIKFTPENGKVILASAIKNNELLITVTDTGVGMSAELVNHFNKSEYQGAGVSTPGTNREKGTGLGLLLCRTFIGLMDSRISVMSETNKGTEFTLFLKKS
ncbi:tetratricopeptide repeat-containing sensor histidine kinase [Pedobacter aquatilis]|uniref:tetratricopeptide repeat-containing sensor histidine kinase n=1 Tax=Pedobacter aquatilis TaxID=351343 RepID=UPI002930FCEC|nr:tetratricopeptide repeat-containing sensor histidine kinase [Pedobacter aquatilis]